MVLREHSLKQGQRLLSPAKLSASSPSAWCQTWIQKLWKSRLALTKTASACYTDDSNGVNLLWVFVLMSVSWTTVWTGIIPSHLCWQKCLSFFFWSLIYHFKGFGLFAKEVCRAGEPQQNECEHGPWSQGLGLWLQPPTLHGWSKSHENRYKVQVMVLRALNHTKLSQHFQYLI